MESTIPTAAETGNFMLLLSKWLVAYNPKVKRLLAHAIGFHGTDEQTTVQVETNVSVKANANPNIPGTSPTTTTQSTPKPKPQTRPFNFQVEAVGSGVVLANVTVPESQTGVGLKKELHRLLPKKPWRRQQLFFGHDGPQIDNHADFRTQYSHWQRTLGNTIVMALK